MGETIKLHWNYGSEINFFKTNIKKLLLFLKKNQELELVVIMHLHKTNFVLLLFLLMMVWRNGDTHFFCQ